MSITEKIIFISGSHGVFGGGQVYLYELDKELKRRGIESCVMSSDSIYDGNLEIPRIDTWSYKLKNFNKVIKILKKHDPDRKAKIVLNDSTLSMLSLILRMHGWTVYSLIHMSIFNTNINSKFVKLSYPLIRAFFIRSGSKLILSVNRENEKILGKKSRYIGNFTVNKWQETSLATKDIDFIYVGRFDIEKQPHLFVDIMDGLREKGLDFRAVMIGDGNLTSEVVEIINRKKLNDFIELKGFLERDEILTYYEKAKLIIITSKTEGLPTVLLDAATRNVDFISPSLGSIPYINNCYNVGKILPHNEMQSYLESFLKDEIAKYRSNEKLKFFADSHHISSFASKFLEIIK